MKDYKRKKEFNKKNKGKFEREREEKEMKLCS